MDNQAKTLPEKEAGQRDTVVQERALIIGNDVNGLLSAGKFLTRRGIETVVVGTLPEAVKLVTSARPKFVFLSYNLKAANIVKTERLLSKTFNVKCCVFAESNDSRTMAVLNSSPFKYTMSSNVSGPSLHMQIKKIERQDEMEEKRRKQMMERAIERMRSAEANAEVEKVDRNEFSSEVQGGEWAPIGKDASGKKKWLLEGSDNKTQGAASGQYTYTGEVPPEKNEDGLWDIPEEGEVNFYSGLENFAQEQDSFNEANEVDENQYSVDEVDEPDVLSEFADQFSVDGGDALDHEENTNNFKLSADEVKPSEGVHFQEKPQAKQKKKLYMPFTEEGYHEKNYDGPMSDEVDETAIEELSTLEPMNDFSDVEEGPQDSVYSEIEEGPKGESYSEIENAPEQNEYKATEESQTPNISNMTKKPSQEFIPDDDKNLYREDPSSGSKMAVADEEFKETADATFDALLDVLDTDDEVENYVDNPKKMRIFSLVTTPFKGLVVMSVAGDRELGDEVNEKIKEKLAHYLKLKKSDIGKLDSFNLEAEEIEFKSWSQNLAKYTIQTQHEKDEVLCSFIEIQEVVGAIKESPDPSMAAVELKNISSDMPLTFDAHLYFPVNKKFIHYVGKGSQITEEQKAKLASSNFKQVHIKKSDSGVYLRYCIINYILNAVNSNANLFKNAV